MISYNPGYQNVLKDLKHSTRQRFVALEFQFPDPPREAKIIAHESGVDDETALQLAKLGHKVRNLREHGLKEGASTRVLIYAGRLIKEGIAPRRACHVAVTWGITDDAAGAAQPGRGRRRHLPVKISHDHHQGHEEHEGFPPENLKLPTISSADVHCRFTAVELGPIREMLRLYCHALTERSVDLQDLQQLVEKNIGWSKSDVATSDGAAIFLPASIERFASPTDNFDFLKVMLTQQAGHIEFGSFRV